MIRKRPLPAELSQQVRAALACALDQHKSLKFTSDQLLTSQEVECLAEFLEAAPGAQLFPYVEGFLTAIASAPTLIMPSKWQEHLLGDNVWESIEEVQQVYRLLMGLYNQVLGGMHSGQGHWTVDFTNEAAMKLWCIGYLEAARMDSAWLADEVGFAMIFPYGVLAGEFSLEGLEDEAGSVIEDPTRHIEKYKKGLTNTAITVHNYWFSKRKPLAPPGTPTVAPLSYGRNDPCPCGSGKKFKRCCMM